MHRERGGRGEETKPILVNGNIIIKNINKISLPDQMFSIKFALNLTWEPEEDIEEDPSKPLPEDWKPKWKPNIELENETEMDVLEESYSWAFDPRTREPIKTTKEDGTVKHSISLRRLIKCECSEQLELESFPYSYQSLGLQFRFSFPQSINKARFNKVNVMLDTRAFRAPEFRLISGSPLYQAVYSGSADTAITIKAEPLDFSKNYSPVRATISGIGRSILKYSNPLNLFKKPSEGSEVKEDKASPTGEHRRIGFSRWTVMILVQHDWHFYIQNIVSFLTLLSLLNFTCWATDVKNVDTRLGLDFTAVLTAVAFKFTFASLIPKLSYMTLLDKYILSIFGILCLITLCHATVLLFEDSEKWDKIMLIFTFALWLLLHIWFTLSSIWAEQRSKYNFLKENITETKKASVLYRLVGEYEEPLKDSSEKPKFEKKSE